MQNTEVFIVGSARSGTSITYLAMREVFRLDGRGESHVFPVFTRMVHEFYKYRQQFAESKVLAHELDVGEFRSSLYPYIRGLYEAAYKGKSFVDKTPGSEQMRSCNLIYGAFPAARILLVRRSGIEVAKSYQSKFNVTLRSACMSWAQCAVAAKTMLQTYPGILEIDQYDLTNAPGDAANRIASYVGQPEKAGQLAEFFISRRVEQRSDHDWQRRLTLADVDWTPADKDMFREVCGEQMVALGYPF